MEDQTPVTNEAGFGMIELLNSMSILAVGLLTMLGTVSEGYVSINRANVKGTATVLADRTMEAFRGGKYSNLTTGTITPVTYTSTSSPPSPDGRTYTVSGTVATATAVNTNISGVVPARYVKTVTISVADSNGIVRASEQSTFDALSGS